MKSIYIFILCAVLAAGCSHTIYERKKSESDPADQGSKTEVNLRGPKVGVTHTF